MEKYCFRASPEYKTGEDIKCKRPNAEDSAIERNDHIKFGSKTASRYLSASRLIGITDFKFSFGSKEEKRVERTPIVAINLEKLAEMGVKVYDYDNDETFHELIDTSSKDRVRADKELLIDSIIPKEAITRISPILAEVLFMLDQKREIYNPDFDISNEQKNRILDLLQKACIEDAENIDKYTIMNDILLNDIQKRFLKEYNVNNRTIKHMAEVWKDEKISIENKEDFLYCLKNSILKEAFDYIIKFELNPKEIFERPEDIDVFSKIIKDDKFFSNYIIPRENEIKTTAETTKLQDSDYKVAPNIKISDIPLLREESINSIYDNYNIGDANDKLEQNKKYNEKKGRNIIIPYDMIFEKDLCVPVCKKFYRIRGQKKIYIEDEKYTGRNQAFIRGSGKHIPISVSSKNLKDSLFDRLKSKNKTNDIMELSKELKKLLRKLEAIREFLKVTSEITDDYKKIMEEYRNISKRIDEINGELDILK